MLPTLSHCTRALSPDAAVALGALGIGLGFVEFNRPGRILPGAAGLLLFLFACAALGERGIRPAAALVLCAALLLLLANLWRPLPLVLLALATILIVAGLRFLCLPDATPGVQTPVALVCGTLLGASSGALTRVAYRARRSKALD